MSISYETIYKYPNDYEPKYITGAYGGIDPQGEISVHFFRDGRSLLKTVTTDTSLEGDVLSEVVTSPEEGIKTLERSVLQGIIMSKATAKAVHRWLGGILEALEETEGLQK